MYSFYIIAILFIVRLRFCQDKYFFPGKPAKTWRHMYFYVFVRVQYTVKCVCIINMDYILLLHWRCKLYHQWERQKATSDPFSVPAFLSQVDKGLVVVIKPYKTWRNYPQEHPSNHFEIKSSWVTELFIRHEKTRSYIWDKSKSLTSYLDQRVF